MRQKLTSKAIPGRNMTTAKAWKDFRLALRLSVGTCLSAASKKSEATIDIWAPLGRFGRFGKLEKAKLMVEVVGVGGALGSLETLLRVSDAPGTTRKGSPWGRFLDRYFLDLASCRFQAATLMMAINAQ